MDWNRTRIALAARLGLSLVHPQARYAAVLTDYVASGSRWLDIGCGRQLVPPWGAPEEQQHELANRAAVLVGIDVDQAIREHPLLSHRVMALGDRLPFRDEDFDLVTANMVVEHLSAPLPFLREVSRVLRPGGRFVFHTPNHHYYTIFFASWIPDRIKRGIIWHLERRCEADVFPTYYRLNTAPRIRRLAHSAGFLLERMQANSPAGAFHRLGPLGVLEVFLLKLLSFECMKAFRPSFIVVLRKP